MIRNAYASALRAAVSAKIAMIGYRSKPA
jgi:hypothetical protein